MRIEGTLAPDQLAAIVEHSEEAIIGKTLEGVVTSWNPAAERMYGYSAKEVIGKSIDLLSPPGQAGEMHTIVDRVRAGQPVERLEITRVRKDGSVITVSLTVSPIHDPPTGIPTRSGLQSKCAWRATGDPHGHWLARP